MKAIEEPGKQLVDSNALIQTYDLDLYNPSFLETEINI